MKHVILLLTFIFIGLVGYCQHSISGSVTDENNTALVGATVRVKDTKIGVVTNSDGQFKLAGLAGESVELVVGFLGYKELVVTAELPQKKKLMLRLEVDSKLFKEILVSASRAGDKTPIAHANIGKEELEKRGQGKDIPMLIMNSPSVTTSSDAGAGIGYTGIRIRGSDISRINVTINGVPLNDPESQGVYWVNMPDFASNINDIQIQRGVGTSSNGAAAFGASIDMRTVSATRKPYTEVSTNYGSFNSTKNSVKVGSGLIADHWAFNARISQITSDGFIDRSTTDMKSFYVTGGYYSENTTLKLTASSGQERTYQAWYGIPKFKLANDTKAIEEYIAFNWLDEQDADNLRNSGARTYNIYTYAGETDNYQQDRYQAIFNKNIDEGISFNSTFFWTHGEGYYEQYKKGKELADYNIEVAEGEPTESDLVQQKWLDNDFYGFNMHFQFEVDELVLKMGLSSNLYSGAHFGKVVDLIALRETNIDHEYYRSKSVKSEFSGFVMGNYTFEDKIHAFADIQYRAIRYKMNGTDDDYRALAYNLTYDFINPKGGVLVDITDNQMAYVSVSHSNREPNRANIIDSDSKDHIVSHESMIDYEFGYKYTTEKLAFAANVYYMDYTDQLVLTGDINSVGNALVTNAAESYRAGIELQAKTQLTDWLTWEANVTWSENKIKNFTEIIPVYNDSWELEGKKKVNYTNTDISFSPAVIANNILTYQATKQLDVTVISKYVGRQYLDNTSTEANSLDPYFITDFGMQYNASLSKNRKLTFTLTMHNMFNEMYESNAWVSKSIVGDTDVVYDGYYPQAGRHFMGGLVLSF